MTAVGYSLAPRWGETTQANREKGAAWFRKARDHYAPLAKNGDTEAQFQLALLLQYAEPIKNSAEAMRWLKKSAAQNHTQAMIRLGSLFDRGEGVPKDGEKAVALYKQAADAGDIEGANALATAYLRGVGCKGCGPEIKESYMKTDAMGSRKHGCHLGNTYLFGRIPSIPNDAAKGLELVEPRAAAGVPECFETMAQVYEQGVGVTADPAEAYKWRALDVLYAHPRVAVYKQPALLKLKQSLDPAIVRDGEQRAYAVEFTPMDAPAAPKPAVAVPAPAAPAAVAAEPSVDAPSRRLKPTPNDFALIVGIERYRSLPAAEYAENDAAAVHRHLADLGVPERNIISLKGDEATRSKLQAYLEEWLPKNVKADSRVYFYFSGHGSPDAKSGQAYLIPSDGDPSYLKSTAFAVKDVYAALNRLPAKQVVVALDSCFSGAGGRSVLPKGARPLVAKVELAGETGKLLVFAAAAGDEISGGLDEQRHGAFTYYFLRGLSGEAKTTSGSVTADSLQSYLRGRVGDAAHRQNRDQTPQLIGDPATVLTRF